jgi:hypothetical protein
MVHMRGLLSAHMFNGLVLMPPVIVKLGSTGYRMASYYAGARRAHSACRPHRHPGSRSTSHGG